MTTKKVHELKIGEAFFFPTGKTRHRVEQLIKSVPTMTRIIANYGKSPNYRTTSRLLFNWEIVTVYE